MKKNYFLAVLFVFGWVTANAQFAEDNMESYGGGNAPILNGTHWSSSDGTPAPALKSTSVQARSGSLSGLVDGGEVTDGLLLLGGKIFGTWWVKYSMYIPSGKIGYWNLQGTEAPGLEYVVGNIYMGNSGIGGDDESTGRIDMGTADETDDWIFTFPKDQWFEIIMNFDFQVGPGAATWELMIRHSTDWYFVVNAGTPYADGYGTPSSGLGAINFSSNSADNEYYIDDVWYINDFFTGPPLGIKDLDALGFTAYPNPVKDKLNLHANEEITSAVVYNILGQEVYNAKFNALTATIDMASFASGAYFVKVNVGGTEGIVKILK